MRLTTSQVFQIGNLLLTYAFALSLLKFDPTTVGIVSAATLTMWNGVGATITKPSDQVNAVVAHIEDPSVKVPLVQAVSQLSGVKTPLQIDPAKATPDLLALANSTAKENDKIEVAK